MIHFILHVCICNMYVSEQRESDLHIIEKLYYLHAIFIPLAKFISTLDT